MRFLGIDYGTKRIGVALSDTEGRLAFPHTILPNDAKVFEKLAKILKEKGVAQLVIGESVNAAGGPNAVAAEIDDFTATLGTNFQLPIHKEKEFLTTVEARRYAPQGGQVDSSAAALILQRYLDKISK